MSINHKSPDVLTPTLTSVHANLPVRNGNSENHAVGKIISVTPHSLTSWTAGFSNIRSKQVNIPNFTPKSVSRIDISASGVVLKPVSPNKLNLRYLQNKSNKFSIMKCTASSAGHLIHFEGMNIKQQC